MYRTILNLKELQNYLANTPIVAFDFETAPDEKYRNEDKASLDAHKSYIVGISFSIAENDSVYLPMRALLKNCLLVRILMERR